MISIRKVMLVAVAMAVSAPAFATIRTVNQFGTAQYQTIGDAISASVTGDTILIAPGTYGENLSVNNRRLTVIGAGWDLVTVNGSVNVYNAGANGSLFEGLRIQSTSGAFLTNNNVDSVTVRRCLLRSTSGAVVTQNTTCRLYVEDCVLIQEGASAHVSVATTTNSTVVVRGCVLANTQASPGVNQVVASGANGSPVEVHNCSMVNFNRAFNLTGNQPLIAINNVFYDWTGTPSWGTYLAGSVLDYTAADATAPAFPAGSTDNISLGANNPFMNYSSATNYQIGTSDLHLNAGAGGLMLTNAGHPLVFDPDGSRSDVGAYGGPRPLVDNGIPAYPFPTSLTIPNLIESGDSLNVNSTGRIGPRY